MKKEKLFNKKILIITFSNISDHQDKALIIYEELLKDGYDVYIIVSSNFQVSIEKSERTWLVKCPDRPGISKGTFNIVSIWKLLKRIRCEGFDYIFFETLHTWNLPILIFPGRKTKTLQMIHDVVPHKGDKAEKQVDLMNRLVCKLADRIIICNEKYRDILSKRYKIDGSRVMHMSLWERFPEYKKTKRTGRVLFFGRLNPYKGVDNLLEIVKQCPHIQFDIVGKVDPQVSNIILDLRKNKNVSVNNKYINEGEIAKYFDSAEWIILPYNSATQSGVIVEAYKNSKPVISFEVGAIREQVIDGETGFLVRKGNNNEFSKVLKRVICMDDVNYENFCKRAYSVGAEQFSAIKATKKLCEMLEGL